VLNAPIEFYQPDGLTVFLPQPDPALKAEVALWLLTPEDQAYAAEVDMPIVKSTIPAPASALRTEAKGAAVESLTADGS
jgi:hypothetical protein